MPFNLYSSELGKACRPATKSGELPSACASVCALENSDPRRHGAHMTEPFKLQGLIEKMAK